MYLRLGQSHGVMTTSSPTLKLPLPTSMPRRVDVPSPDSPTTSYLLCKAGILVQHLIHTPLHVLYQALATTYASLSPKIT
jgi:hypothetical protein